MRQPQHNKRSRGRGRKPQHSANRSYESNGPDVKIRGSASHIAEKYMTLSRDAQSSGDEVSAQNYMQHAEHYLRVVAAAQSFQNSQQGARSDQPHVNGGGDHGNGDARETRGDRSDDNDDAASGEDRGRRDDGDTAADDNQPRGGEATGNKRPRRAGSGDGGKRSRRGDSDGTDAEDKQPVDAN